MAGRPRKPKVVKIAQGTFRQDQEVGQEPEPEVSSSVRSCPSHVGSYGKKLWKELADELVSSGIMTEVDWQSLEFCCESYNTYRESRDAVYHTVDRICASCGQVLGYQKACESCGEEKVKLKKRKRKLAEYLALHNSQTGFELTTMHKAKEQFLKYAVQLGITPAARNKIDISGKSRGEKSEIEKMWEESHG
jgi:P27 family predicted phage terminase small subunit